MFWRKSIFYFIQPDFQIRKRKGIDFRNIFPINFKTKTRRLQSCSFTFGTGFFVGEMPFQQNRVVAFFVLNHFSDDGNQTIEIDFYFFGNSGVF